MTKQEKAQELLDKIEDTRAAFHAHLDAHEEVTNTSDEYVRLWNEMWNAETEGRRFLQELNTNPTTTCIWMLKCVAHGLE